jgi:sarcosine oxidase / L-pipecolate oxidase
MASSRRSTDWKIPRSIIIVGSGVFGLSTALGLAEHPSFGDSLITVVDQHPFPSPTAASASLAPFFRRRFGYQRKT